VKAGIYPIAGTIKIKESNVQIQGEGMGITVFVGNSAMTGNTPISANLFIANVARILYKYGACKQAMQPMRIGIYCCPFSLPIG
jgi:hypothetical protein